jgi:hypothetical protein
MRPRPPGIKVGSSGDPQATTLRDRFGSSNGENNRRKFDWSDANAVLVAEAVTRCVSGGDACMFGVTRDGGCGVITVLSGDDRKRFYPSDGASADQALMQISWAYATSEQRKEFPVEFVPIGGK